MTILSFIGLAVLCLISVTLVVGGLLNLGGCGDRIGDEYRLTNYLQIFLGALLATILILCL